jgi:hypothetical protein
VKLLLNSVISTPDAEFMTLNIQEFYLNTPMKQAEYGRVALRDIPKAIIEHYGLELLANDTFIYSEIIKGMYGLPQAGILANDDHFLHLNRNGYIQSAHTPGHFTHQTRPISFCLVVDDFGVKSVGKKHAQHIIDILQQKYTITTGWTGAVYVGLHWDYVQCTVDISMPNYFTKALQRFDHQPPSTPQHAPHSYTPPQYGAKVQLTLLPDTSPALSAKQIERLQQII